MKLLLLIILTSVVAFDFSQFFSGGGHHQQQQQRDEEVTREGGKCKGFLCNDMNGPCVASPDKCPCRHSQQVKCQLASGKILCLPPDVKCDRLKKQN